MLELFGIIDGTLEVRARGWALAQFFMGFFSVILGIILLFAMKRELRFAENHPQFTFILSERNGRVYVRPILHPPEIVEIVTPYVPTWDSGLTVVVGFGFVIMGALLLVAVYQKSVRKCSIWLMFTIPMCLSIFCGSLYKSYEHPSLNQLTNTGIYSVFFYAIQVVCSLREEYKEMEERARIIKERELD